MSTGVDAALQRAARELGRVTAQRDLAVEGLHVRLADGRTCAQRWAPDTRRDVCSVSKTITALALGIAADEGLLDLADSVLTQLTQLPELAGAFLRTEEIGRLAELLLGEGVFRGCRVVPAQHVRAMREETTDTARAEPDNRTYGLGAWRGARDGGWRLDGIYGQFGVVLPALGAWVSVTSPSRSGGSGGAAAPAARAMTNAPRLITAVVRPGWRRARRDGGRRVAGEQHCDQQDWQRRARPATASTTAASGSVASAAALARRKARSPTLSWVSAALANSPAVTRYHQYTASTAETTTPGRRPPTRSTLATLRTTLRRNHVPPPTPTTVALCAVGRVSVRDHDAMDIEVCRGDITRVAAEVLVTAANSALVGGGVDAAIHAAAGPRLLQALRALSPCPPGGAVITPAFDLPDPVRHVVHALGPRFGRDEPAGELLAGAYTAALRRCDEVGARSVAFASLSTGAYRYPLEAAGEISVTALRAADTLVQCCLLVAFDARTEQAWRAALAGP